ncbi:hypothetical protein BJ508DRAFT_367112 [Ascobolus immersus RN42]|uniref:Uncharacterized protein n=1 Tax=Ascobolus immersus RN42 TaxID=1160509 RepID=A0A3N4HI50_ASCIM|nr:hypothetical protein BJ508DRAFT_367112 [Ascobolus immersus RN42]
MSSRIEPPKLEASTGGGTGIPLGLNQSRSSSQFLPTPESDGPTTKQQFYDLDVDGVQQFLSKLPRLKKEDCKRIKDEAIYGGILWDLGTSYEFWRKDVGMTVGGAFILSQQMLEFVEAASKATQGPSKDANVAHDTQTGTRQMRGTRRDQQG